MHRRIFPRSFLERVATSSLLFRITRARYLLFGRPRREAETAKARSRRLSEGFFSSYCNGSGLDVGYGGDLLTQNCRGYDIENGDAQLLDGVEDESYDFVYSSHTLEHMPDPAAALFNWWRAVKPGGFLILYLPHRDLYEKKTALPSNWNFGHKHFFLPERDEPPDTLGIVPLIERSLDRCEIVYVKTCSMGHTVTDPEKHSDGEYSIEVVMKKEP